ncbi:MAG TPA: SDR family NAD(P)-dependent oxidoreductase [Solirubrobacterales bacterium]|jgi:NAD(P)-dependent dehydrogenase (short-subunit alcohol dehydrogenase family)|nr:SDR family NAD(P)-dependent oxidoreductase [Solirubrobacterales bacterium]
MQSVLVTGASTGIGRTTALQLDRAGWRVFAGVRRDEDAASLREAGSERIRPLMLDVTDAAQISAAAGQIEETVGETGLDGLVNNAGIAVPGPLETLPIDDFKRQVEVNLTAHVAVTQAALPAIRLARGRIVFITSIGGLMAFPMFGAYHAAKFGLEAVGDVFRRELRPWDIAVSIVEPGSIATPIWERGEQEVDAIAGRAGEGHAALYGEAIAAGKEIARKTGERGIPPEKVAATIERALTARRPRTRYLVGADARGQAFAARFLPARLVDSIVARITGV